MSEESSGQDIRIIVVDDEKMILQAFERLMVSENRYKPNFFSDAVEAVKQLKESPDQFDVVMTDIRMPGLDGIEFIRQVKEIRPDIPVLFMTGDCTDEAREEALSFDKVVFLEKPFHLSGILKETIPNLLEG